MIIIIIIDISIIVIILVIFYSFAIIRNWLKDIAKLILVSQLFSKDLIWPIDKYVILLQLFWTLHSYLSTLWLISWICLNYLTGLLSSSTLSWSLWYPIKAVCFVGIVTKVILTEFVMPLPFTQKEEFWYWILSFYCRNILQMSNIMNWLMLTNQSIKFEVKIQYFLRWNFTPVKSSFFLTFLQTKKAYCNEYSILRLSTILRGQLLGDGHGAFRAFDEREPHCRILRVRRLKT